MGSKWWNPGWSDYGLSRYFVPRGLVQVWVWLLLLDSGDDHREGFARFPDAHAFRVPLHTGLV